MKREGEVKACDASVAEWQSLTQSKHEIFGGTLEMAFERKWSHPGVLSDAELSEALSLVLRDLEINKMLDELFENTRDVRLGKAERDRDLEDRLGVRTYQLIVSAFSNATLRDGYEISRHLFDEVARRLGSIRAAPGRYTVAAGRGASGYRGEGALTMKSWADDLTKAISAVLRDFWSELPSGFRPLGAVVVGIALLFLMFRCLGG